MISTNPGWVRLSQIPPVKFKFSNLSGEIRTKILDTYTYSMGVSPGQNTEDCLRKCAIAIFAEYYVADWMDGYVNSGLEDTSDPYTYAYDVLSHPRYCGLRIEVKTHRIGKYKSVRVKTGNFGKYPDKYGINIGPFINYNVADIIIMFKAKSLGNGVVYLTPLILSDRESFERHGVMKSKFPDGGWILNTNKKTNCPDGTYLVY